MPAHPLTPAQIQFFKDEGYLAVPGLIEPVYLDVWRQQLWATLGGRAGDPATWGERRADPPANFQPPEVQFHNHPRLRAIIEQLGGGRFVYGHDACVINWPSESTAWQPTDRGHIDGYRGPGLWWPFMLTATTYLEDVEPMGGGLMLWPQSHLATWKWYRQSPEMVDGRWVIDPDFDWSFFGSKAPRPPYEFAARAGDVVFWHAFMSHNGSANIRRDPRLALFSRWQHQDQDAIKYEVPENLWKHWAI